MKFFRKKFSFIFLITITLLTSSCSWMSKRKVLFENDSEPKAAKKKSSSNAQMVTKNQYDQLLNKYENLLEKIKKAETTSVKKMDQQMSSSPEVRNDAAQNQMMKELSKITPQADLAETVDVFAKGGMASNVVDTSDVLDQAPKMSDNEIQSQLDALQKANNLVRQNKVDSALILLKDLEDSKNKQIKVRAKYYLAEMLFRQSEFDLAMQMYEEIVKKYAFSGLVIKSLGRLIVCSEKLKLGKKKERYYSILHDFFGV